MTFDAGIQAAMGMGDYVLQICEPLTDGGTVLAEMGMERTVHGEGLHVTEAVRELNRSGSIAYDFPLRSRKMREFRGGGLDGKHLKLWRQDKCVWWGVNTKARIAGNAVVAGGSGPMWYFDGINFGPIINNYLTNPNFSTGDLSGWTAVGVTAGFDASFPIRTTPGGVAGSAKLIQATAGVDTYIHQYVEVITGPTQPTFFTLAAWYELDPSGVYNGPAYLERGAYIGRQDLSHVDIQSAWARINNRLPGWGKLQRLTAGISVPASSHEFLDCRLYAPGLTSGLWWGASSLTIEESVGGAAGVTMDVTDILELIVDYSQDPTREKVDQGIIYAQLGGGANPATGVPLERHYQFFDLANIGDSIREFPQIGACDIGIVWDKTNPTTLWFQTFPGSRGVVRSNLAVESALDDLTGQVQNRLLRDYSLERDIERAADDVVWFGKGSGGSDREFGRARDLSLMGGLLRQRVTSAPSDAGLDTLDSRAGVDLAAQGAAIHVPSVTIPGEYAAEIDEGDYLPVRIDYGFAYEDTLRRAVRTHLNPMVDLLTLDMN